jgi:hypothetical protein
MVAAAQGLPCHVYTYSTKDIALSTRCHSVVSNFFDLVLATMSVGGNHMIPLPVSRQYFFVEGGPGSFFFSPTGLGLPKHHLN